MSLLPVICALFGMAIVLVAVPQALSRLGRANLLDRSSDFHHTHQKPVPRIGGLVLALAFVLLEIFIAFVTPAEREHTPGRMAAILSSLAMFGLGFWDDIRPLGAKKKFFGQVLIAAAVLLSGIGIQQFKIPFTSTIIDLGIWGVFLTILWLVAMTNLINLIDGVDGLAGGICLMLMVLIAFVGYQNGSFELLASGMAGALLGFLWFNFPPARIYLGDGGAYFLGFQIGLFSIINSHKGTVFVALVAPLFVLALPIVDTCLAILRRGLRGLPVFRPDRRHIHHHLIRMGLSRRRVVLWIYGITLLFLLMGLLAYWSRGNLVPVLLGFMVVILLFLAGKLEFSREWFAIGRVLGNSLGMRQQVRYALSLTKWLELEGSRRSSVDDLFSDLVFAAQKLGFSSLKLVFEERTLQWRDPQLASDARTTTFQFNSRYGSLQIGAGACPASGDAPKRCERLSDPAGVCCPCVCDGNVFEIVSELLAEGWTRSVAAWQGRCRGAETSPPLGVPVFSKTKTSAPVWQPAIPVAGNLQEEKP